VTVGHCAVMEDCKIESYALIGSNATLLNGCTIGEGALIAAGSVVGQKATIPPRVVAAGAPAVVKKALEGEAATWIQVSAEEYVKLSRMYLAQSLGTPEDQDLTM
jgi:carbonic anhydrase/acetyltransferase-like protein (isoleucine patch superfamily)